MKRSTIVLVSALGVLAIVIVAFIAFVNAMV